MGIGAMATVIGDIDGLAVLTSLGYLICRECWRQPQIRADQGRPIVGRCGSVVCQGDTYSDEICDTCGRPVDREYT